MINKSFHSTITDFAVVQFTEQVPELFLPDFESYLASLSRVQQDTPIYYGGPNESQHGMSNNLLDKNAQMEIEQFQVGQIFPAFQSEHSPRMVVLPAGEFFMGAHPLDPDAQPNEMPRRLMSIHKPFAVSLTPITFDEWSVYAQQETSSHKPHDSGWGRGRRPVSNVSWYDANAYVTWLSIYTGKKFRLLSEVEWEFAFWAGQVQQARYPWGDDLSASALKNFAWYQKNSGGKTQLVGTLPSNPWHLHDLLGNVSEWVQDHYTANLLDLPTGGEAYQLPQRHMNRVIRGGAWLDAARNVRPSHRESSFAEHRSYKTGFRIAMTLP